MYGPVRPYLEPQRGLGFSELQALVLGFRLWAINRGYKRPLKKGHLVDIHGSVEGLYRRDIGFVEWKRKELHRYFGGFMCI